MIISACVQCQREGHLFDKPLCKSQSLIKRIVNVLFHIFTLGIPFVLYHVLMYCFKKGCPSEIDIGHLHKKYLENIRLGFVDRPPISELGKRIIEEVYSEISSALETLDRHDYFSELEKRPSSDELLKLCNLSFLAHSELTDKINSVCRDQKDPWKDEEVIGLANRFIKLSYVAGMTMLDDLPSYQSKLQSIKNKHVTYINILLLPEYYPHKVTFRLLQAYLICRSAAYLDEYRNLCVYGTGDTVSKEHVDRFYISGNLQNEWRLLHNEYCNRILLYVSEDEIIRDHKVFSKWIQPDINPDIFRYIRPGPRV